MYVLAEQFQELVTAVNRLNTQERPISVATHTPDSPAAGSSGYQPMPVVSENEAPPPLTPFDVTQGETTGVPSDDLSSSEMVVRRRKRRSERPALPDKDRMWGPKMLAMIPWAGRFFSGPKDPVAHPFSAHCRVCQADVSVKSKGHYDIVRHWVRDKHFRREQKYRDEHGLEVLNRQRQVSIRA